MIALVSCCGPKLSTPAPAAELYVSPLFRLSRAWAEKHCERWFILSALHGLVSPTMVISPYDRRLGRNDREWGACVVRHLAARDLAAARFAVLAGENYVRPLRGAIDLHEPLAGLGIGERLKWLKERTSEKAVARSLSE